MNARSILMFAFLGAAAVGSWYVASRFETSEVTRTAPGGPTTGFYLRTARILGTDERGELLYEIEAEYAEQQQNSDIELENVQWLGLKVRRVEQGNEDDEDGVVEFVARYKVDGRGHRLHEVSRFQQLNGQWYYLDGSQGG